MRDGYFIARLWADEEEKFRAARRGAVLICAGGGSAGEKWGLTDRDICFGNKLFAKELYGAIPSKIRAMDGCCLNYRSAVPSTYLGNFYLRARRKRNGGRCVASPSNMPAAAPKN